MLPLIKEEDPEGVAGRELQGEGNKLGFPLSHILSGKAAGNGIRK